MFSLDTLPLMSPNSLIEKGLLIAERGLPSDLYADRETRNLRTLCISSSSFSVLCGLVFFYCYYAVHPSRLKFRHRLIFVLMLYDFFKALSILIFPIYSYVNPSNIGAKTANFLGFITALSIEGGDLAILAFAMHTSLVIFNPKRGGGLYHWRYYYYVSTVVIPVLLAALPFASVGYTELQTWCYLPVRPIWLRIGLSFGPRLFVILVIVIIYSSIYFYVIRQLKYMNSQRKTINLGAEKKLKWWSLEKYFNKAFKADTSVITQEQDDTKLGVFDINIQLQLDNSQRLKTRYKVISRQVKSIFLYPTAYVLLWIFPFITNGLRLSNHSNYPLNCIVSFFTPLNAAVDFAVYLIRETPWRFTYLKTDRSPFAPVETVPKWRYYARHLPLYGLPQDVIEQFQSQRDGLQQFASKEQETTQKNVGILQYSINPEEFLNAETFSNSYISDPKAGIISSNSDDSTKRHMSTDGSVDDEVEMDLKDFLNRGPPS